MANIKDLRADAQYLREFYEWNKKRHPEWDGEYILKIAEGKEAKANYEEYEKPVYEYWYKLRTFLRDAWKNHSKKFPFVYENEESKWKYFDSFVEELKILNVALEYKPQVKTAIWKDQGNEYKIRVINSNGAYEVHLWGIVDYKTPEGKIKYISVAEVCNFTECLIGTIYKEDKNA